MPVLVAFVMFFMGTLGLATAIEFDFISMKFFPNSCILIATIITCILLYLQQIEIKNKLRMFSKPVLGGIALLVLFHLLTNSLNIYNTIEVPAFFYQAKLHRLVSLSAVFLLQIVTLACGLGLALHQHQNSFKLPKQSWYKVLIVVYLSSIIAVQSQLALAAAYKDVLQVAVNITTSFDERITYKLGGSSYYGWIWPYTRFIIKHTAPDAVITIPPQSVVWKMEGKADYVRWYLYPRKTIKQLPDNSIPPEAEYALIAVGECEEGDCGWPKVAIPKERIEYIVLIDREAQMETIIQETDYVLDINKFTWGIIKFKK